MDGSGLHTAAIRPCCSAARSSGMPVRWVTSRDASERALADWHSTWRCTVATAALQRLFGAMFAQNVYAGFRGAFTAAAGAGPILPTGEQALLAVRPVLSGAQLSRKSKRRATTGPAKASAAGQQSGAQSRDGVWVPLAQRKRENSYEQNVAALQGKRLVRHMVVNVKSLQYREYNENRSKLMTNPNQAVAAVAVGSFAGSQALTLTAEAPASATAAATASGSSSSISAAK